MSQQKLGVDRWLRELLQKTVEDMNRDRDRKVVVVARAANKRQEAPHQEDGDRPQQLTDNAKLHPIDGDYLPTKLDDSWCDVPVKSLHEVSSESKSSTPESNEVHSNESTKVLLQKVRSSFRGKDTKCRRTIKKHSSLISDGSRVFIAKKRSETEKNLGTSGFTDQNIPWFSSQFTAVSSTQPFLASGSSMIAVSAALPDVSGIPPPHNFKPRQQQNQTISFAQLLAIRKLTEIDMQKRTSPSATELKEGNHDKMTSGTAILPEKLDQISIQPTKQISRSQQEKYILEEADTSQNTSLLRLPYPGLICFDQLPPSFYQKVHQMSPMSRDGETAQSSQDFTATKDIKHIQEFLTNAHNLVKERHLEISAPDHPLVNQVPTHPTENAESNLSRHQPHKPSEESDSKPCFGDSAPSALYPLTSPNDQSPGFILNIPYTSTLTSKVIHEASLSDTGYIQKYRKVNICPYCNNVSLCPNCIRRINTDMQNGQIAPNADCSQEFENPNHTATGVEVNQIPKVITAMQFGQYNSQEVSETQEKIKENTVETSTVQFPEARTSQQDMAQQEGMAISSTKTEQPEPGSGHSDVGTANLTIVQFSSYEHSSTEVHAALHTPQTGAGKRKTSEGSRDRDLRPGTQMRQTVNVIDKEEISVTFLKTKTTSDKNLQIDFVAEDARQVATAKLISEGIASSAVKDPESTGNHACISKTAATREVKDHSQQATAKMAEYVSTASAVIQKEVIARGLFVKDANAGRAKKILRELGVGKVMSELFQHALDHLKECKKCCSTLSPVVEKLDEKFTELTSAETNEKLEVTSLSGTAATTKEDVPPSTEYEEPAERDQIIFPETAAEDLARAFGSDSDVRRSRRTGRARGEVQDECLLEPYSDRFQYTDDELTAVLVPENLRLLLDQVRAGRTLAAGGAWTAAGGTGYDEGAEEEEGERATPRARNVAAPGSSSDACPAELSPRASSVRTTVELEPLDARNSEASLALSDESRDLVRDYNLGHGSPGVGLTQGDAPERLYDSPRIYSPRRTTEYHLEHNVTQEDFHNITRLYHGQETQFTNYKLAEVSEDLREETESIITSSAPETTTDARRQLDDTFSSDRGSDAADSDDGRWPDACREESASTDTRTIQSPVSVAATSTSSSVLQETHSGYDQQPTSEEQLDHEGCGNLDADAEPAMEGTPRKPSRAEEVVESLRAAARQLQAKYRNYKAISALMNKAVLGHRHSPQCWLGADRRRLVRRIRCPTKIVKEVSGRSVPRDLKVFPFGNNVILWWERPNLPDCLVIGFEVYVNSRLYESVVGNLRDRLVVHDVDFGEEVDIAVYALTEEGRLDVPARVKLLP